MLAEDTATELHPTTLFANGEFVRSEATSRLTLTDPATGVAFASAPDGTPRDVDLAVAAARAAFDDGGWPQSSRSERAGWLRALADALQARGADVARLVTREVGHPRDFSYEKNVVRPAEILRYYADVAAGSETDVPRAATSWQGTTTVGHRPLGVAGLIVPWNYPQSLTMAKLAPALAAGCTVVIKPAPQTSIDALLLAQASRDAKLPRGVINVVTGGAATGVALVSHPGVDKISFTGSTAAGRRIGEVCGRLLRSVTLELGGKSAAVVLADADLDRLAAELPRLAFANAGQTCHAHSRLVVPRALVPQIEEIAESVASSFILGDPFDPTTTMGPLVSAEQRERVHGQVRTAAEEGARIVAGGSPASDLPGFFYQPTVVSGVAAEQSIAQEELFGPVLSVIAYDDESDAVRIADSTPYGLAGTVFSRDPEHAATIARSLRTGAVGLNGFRPDIGAPFGGVGHSGIGREYGPESIDEYCFTQSVYAPR